ncbi:hypothetical protein [Halorarius litoreus]|uniref:hypothetical protein n=1 Tax=Halorarius litoreus TaxID=2962676 RepID=UPI0020CEBC25|nr:hypothetical protein [Halorarius litoreus]
MQWVCPECDRRYADPPDDCVCGGQPVPEGTPDSTDRLTMFADHLYRVLFDPESLDRNLLGGGPYVEFAFRLLLAFSALLVVVLLLGVVLELLL